MKEPMIQNIILNPIIHAKWQHKIGYIEVEEGHRRRTYNSKCSRCFFELGATDKSGWVDYDYCPKCGAKMDE